MHNELEAWFEGLSVDEKLLIIKKLLTSAEKEISLPQNEISLSKQAEPELFDLAPPPMQWDDFDQVLLSDDKSESDESVLEKRLSDAADRFRALLIRYGYVKRPPTFRELALKAYEEDKLIAYQNRKKPDWHNWVTKEDELKLEADSENIEVQT